jgi:hypothetical protein
LTLDYTPHLFSVAFGVVGYAERDPDDPGTFIQHVEGKLLLLSGDDDQTQVGWTTGALFKLREARETDNTRCVLTLSACRRRPTASGDDPEFDLGLETLRRYWSKAGFIQVAGSDLFIASTESASRPVP